MKYLYHCIISIVKEIRFIIGNFLKQAAAPIPPPPPSYYLRKFSDDGNLPVKYRPKTEVLELPALSFQIAHNRVEGAGEVTVSSTKCLECRSRESGPLRSGREAPTLSAGLFWLQSQRIGPLRHNTFCPCWKGGPNEDSCINCNS